MLQSLVNSALCLNGRVVAKNIKSLVCCFSKTCGQNLVVTKNTAQWNISYSGGRAFTSRPIRPGETVILNLYGSGHVEFGLLYVNPETIMNISHVENISDFKYLQTTKVHKIGGKIHVVSSTDGTQITCRRDYQECSVDIDANRDTWVTANILFGNVTVEMASPNMHFHRIAGENLRITAKMTKISLKTTNPSCVCFIPQRLHDSERLRLNMTPIQSDGRAPSTYFVKMAVSDSDPETFMKNLPPIYCLEDLPVTTIPSETYSLEGDIKVRICDNEIITEQENVHQTVAKTGFDIRQGFYCLFELYRVKLTASEKLGSLEKITSPQTVFNGAKTIHQTDLNEETILKQVHISRVKSEVRFKFVELFSIIETLEESFEQNNDIKQDFDVVRCKLSEIESKLNLPSRNHGLIEETEIAQKIREHFSSVLTFIDPLPLADHLFQENIISFDNYQQVRNKWQIDPINAKRDLLSMLIIRKVDESTIRKVLTDSKQGHVIDILFSNKNK